MGNSTQLTQPTPKRKQKSLFFFGLLGSLVDELIKINIITVNKGLLFIKYVNAISITFRIIKRFNFIYRILVLLKYLIFTSSPRESIKLNNFLCGMWMKQRKCWAAWFIHWGGLWASAPATANEFHSATHPSLLCFIILAPSSFLLYRGGRGSH